MCEGHNSIKVCSIVPKTELDLDILVKNLLPNFISITAAKQYTFPSLKGGIENKILSPATSFWQETCVSRVIIHSQRVYILAIMFQEQSLLSLWSFTSNFNNNMVTIQEHVLAEIDFILQPASFTLWGIYTFAP